MTLQFHLCWMLINCMSLQSWIFFIQRTKLHCRWWRLLWQWEQEWEWQQQIPNWLLGWWWWWWSESKVWEIWQEQTEYIPLVGCGPCCWLGIDLGTWGIWWSPLPCLLASISDCGLFALAWTTVVLTYIPSLGCKNGAPCCWLVSCS